MRIRVEQSDTVATIWFDNQSKRNAFDPAMLLALVESAVELASNETVSVVVLRGAGGLAFSAGADFQSFEAENQAQFVDRFNAMERAIDRAATALTALPQPLIAALEGVCFGGAVQLALCADFRIANNSMRLSIPASSIGLAYPLDAIGRLIALVGPGLAKFVLMTGHPLTAADCLRTGLVELVTADVEFEPTLSELCALIARQSQPALRAYKQIVNGFMQGGGDRAELIALHGAVKTGPEAWSRVSQLIANRKAKRSKP